MSKIDEFEEGLSRLGLEPCKGSSGLNYSGAYRGQRVKLHASARRRTKYAGEVRYRVSAGMRLEITVETPLATRLSLASGEIPLQWLVKRSNCWMGAAQVDVPPELSRFQVWASEPEWAELFLKRVSVQEQLRIAAPPESVSSIGVKASPEKWTFSKKCSPSELTPDFVKSRLDALCTLNEVALDEPPEKEVKKVWVERANPIAVGLLFLFVPLLGLVSFGFLLFLLILGVAR